MLVLLALITLAASCRHPDEKSTEDASPSADAPRRLQVPVDVVTAANIQVSLPVRERLDAIVEIPGQTAADPDRIASIASPSAGRIDAVSARLGDVVRKGDPLFSIRVPELSKLRADAAAKQALNSSARENAQRVTDLYAQHAASEKDAQHARAEAEALDAQARSANEVLRALGSTSGAEVANSLLTLRAPIAGKVIERNAVLGQPVTADQVLATIGDTRQVWFLLRVYEDKLAQVRVGDAAEIVLAAYPDRRFEGKIAYVGEQLDPATRAATARVVLGNPDGVLRTGLFGVARLKTGSPDGGADSLVVPEGAVVELAGRPTIFVRVSGSEFDVRPVGVGARVGGRVGIRSGLRDGESVVTDGAFTLKSVALRGSLAEGE